MGQVLLLTAQLTLTEQQAAIQQYQVHVMLETGRILQIVFQEAMLHVK